MPILLLIAAVLLLAAKDDAPSSSTSSDPPPPGGDVYMTCSEALEHLPQPMRLGVAQAIATGTDRAKLLELANALEVGASAQPDIYMRAALIIAAQCVRDRAVEVGGGAPAPSALDAPSAGPEWASPAPPAPSWPTPSPAPTPATSSSSSSVATPSATSSSYASSSTVPSTTADGSAPIFSRTDATEQTARVGATYAATPPRGTALQR